MFNDLLNLNRIQHVAVTPRLTATDGGHPIDEALVDTGTTVTG
jgi:hypothetical protein